MTTISKQHSITLLQAKIAQLSLELAQLAEQLTEEQTESTPANEATTLLTISEACTVYPALSAYTLRQWIKHGDIKCTRLGAGKNGKIVFAQQEIERKLNK